MKFEALAADNSTRSPIFEQRESTVGRMHLINIYQRSIFLRWKKKKKRKNDSIKKIRIHAYSVYLGKERDK